jgi:hypothetical protein
VQLDRGPRPRRIPQLLATRALPSQSMQQLHVDRPKPPHT